MNLSQEDRIEKDKIKKKEFEERDFVYYEIWEKDIYEDVHESMQEFLIKKINPRND